MSSPVPDVADAAALRRAMRARRAQLDAAARRDQGAATARGIRGHRWYRHAERIAMYLPVRGEVDVTALIEHAWAARKRVYLPVLVPFGANRLWFAPYAPDTPMRPNRFGILEPAIAPRHRVDPRRLDLVLTPLVAFDADGHRLGMGGGYYDRSFAFRRHASHAHPRLLGVAHAFQQVDALPAQPWDVPLDGVATETHLLTFPTRTPR